MTDITTPRGPLPRQELLRAITDRAVLDEVLLRGKVTRAEVATQTGLSKPTISTCIARLVAAGLLAPTGSRTGQRGRVATIYELAPRAGWVLALDVDADGVHTRSADLTGAVFDDHDHPPVAPGDVAAMVRRVRAAVRRSVRIGSQRHGDVRAVALSVANAVDPATGEILALPNTPFPEGLLDPARVFADIVPVGVHVENDINCAALAEHRSGRAVDVADFAYLFVGAGLGQGLYVGGQLVRGAHGLAGEVGYLATSTDASSFSTLVGALTSRGLGRGESSALDVAALVAVLDATESSSTRSSRAVKALGQAIGHVIVDTCAVVDPELVLLGGPLGRRPALLEIARRTVAELSPAPVRVELGSLGEAASLQGALHLALDHAHRMLPTSY
jgi:predicted NBD/HSP70 family sugar kinase